MTIFVMILSIGLSSLGILSLLKRSESKKLDYFRKINGLNVFFIWLILSNVLFYIYFLLVSLLYNCIVVNSDFSERIDGSAGGYYTTEDIANQYFSLSSFLIWSFTIINIILFLSRFFLKPNPNLVSINEKTKGIFTILLFFLSIISCFVSLMLLILLDHFSVSYGG
jgi:hypothetical protein